jgi:methyl-accepting chemotaxis protein
MDHGTQQNAALVEQVAAAASALQQQSAQLEDAVARFKIAPASGHGAAEGRAPRLTVQP